MCLMVSFTYSNQTKNTWNVSMLKYLNTHFCVIHWIIINLNRLKCDVVDLWTHKGRGWLRWAVHRGWRASQHSRQLSVTRCGSSWPHERGDMVHRCHTCPTGGVTMWQRSVSWWLFKHFNRDLWTFFHLLFFFMIFFSIFNWSPLMLELSLSRVDRMEGFNRVAFRRKQHSLDGSHPAEAGECCSATYITITKNTFKKVAACL